MRPPAEADQDYAADVERLRDQAPDFAAELACFTGISSVLDWMKTRNLTRAAVDIVGQDEFHYDFLIQLEPHRRWISFGVT